MGFDLHGRSGNYFRANVWYWRPIHKFLADVSDEQGLMLDVQERMAIGFNDGCFIPADKAIRIADKIKSMLENGEMDEIVNAHEAERKSLPQVVCSWCNGTGVRNKPIPVYDPETETTRNVPWSDYLAQHPDTPSCNACEGKGKVDNWDAHYPMTVGTMAEFATFCKNSEGFEVW